MNDVAGGPVSITADQIVQQYISIRDYVRKLEREHEDKLKPYKEAMAELSTAADTMMKQTGQTGLKTTFGTCFYSHTVSVTCPDPRAFHHWVLETRSLQFLTAHVSKEAVQEHMATFEGQLPPGIAVQQIVNVQFRKA